MKTRMDVTSTVQSNMTFDKFNQKRKEHMEKFGEGFKMGLDTNVQYSTALFTRKDFFLDEKGLPLKVVKNIDSTKKTIQIPKENCIEINTNMPLSLGEYNGVEIEINRDICGNIHNNFNITSNYMHEMMRRSPQLREEYLERREKITEDQFKEIGYITRAFQEFTSVAEGKRALPQIKKSDGIWNQHLKIGLEKLGVDVSNPFSINGEEFYFDDNEVVQHLYVKKYTKLDDSTVEVSNVYNFKVENDKLIEL